MTEKEQALFYRDICSRGISIYDISSFAANSGSLDTFAVSKIFTPFDRRKALKGSDEDTLSFETEEAAIAFVKKFIDWTYLEEAPEPQEAAPEPPPAELIYVLPKLYVNFGLGVQVIDLPVIGADPTRSDLDRFIEHEADEAADKFIRDYLAAHHVELKYDDVQKEVKLYPTKRPV